MTTLSHLRRLGATLLVPTTLLLSACGIHARFTIHDNDTVDYGLTAWDPSNSGAVTETSCSEEVLGSKSVPEGAKATYTLTSYKGSPACEVTVSGAPLSLFAATGTSGSITHEGDTYTFTVPKAAVETITDIEAGGDDLEMSMTVTFPGQVTEVSGNGTKDGNSATWDNLLTETEDLRAVATASGSGSSSTIVLVFSGLLVVVVAGSAAVFLRRRRSADAAETTSGKASKKSDTEKASKDSDAEKASKKSDTSKPSDSSDTGKASKDSDASKPSDSTDVSGSAEAATSEPRKTTVQDLFDAGDSADTSPDESRESTEDEDTTNKDA